MKHVKKIISIIIFIVVAVAVRVALYGGNSGMGDHEIKINGENIELNKTTVQDMIDKGYEISDTKYYKKPNTITANTYSINYCASINKDEEQYASIKVVNKTNSEANLEDCQIIGLDFEGSQNDKNLEIDGYNPLGMKEDELKSKLGDNYKKDENKIIVEDGDYTCTYYIDDSEVSSAMVSVNVK